MKENPYNNMDHGAYRIAYLVAGYIRHTLTEKEHRELDIWINDNDHNMQFFEELTDEDNLKMNLAWMDNVQSAASYKKLKESGAFNKSSKFVKQFTMWIAAAVLIFMISLFFIFRNLGDNKLSGKEIANADSTNLQPGGNRATLQLSDGSLIDLTAAKNGLLKTEDGTAINKSADGKLLYASTTTGTTNPSMNVLTTPIGGQFQVQLPDGTNVWLNAATTLRYPSRFSSTERNVEVDGEAYFEVAKNEKVPFHVMMNDSTKVQVYGTHFNVMAYDNEKEKEVTLVEGSVGVTKNEKAARLEPGAQAIISSSSITKKINVDVDAITGWKNGSFVFHDAPIELIMRQIERWYDATIVYKANSKQYFNATISRNEPLSKLLHLLEVNGYVHFKTENKTIYVLP